MKTASFFPEKNTFATSSMHRVHWRFTLTFTGISSLILVVMSIIYLSTSEKELSQNAQLSFSSETYTVLSSIKQQDYLTNNWLSGIAQNSSYALAIYDNHSPVTYTRTALTATEQQITSDIYQNSFETLLASSGASHDGLLVNHDFSYQASDGLNYYVTIARIGPSTLALDVIILFPTAALQQQLLLQRLRFFGINIAGILLLFLFSFFYTWHLLTPIETAQRAQMNFIASASHELRTPLTVILTSISALSKADAAMQAKLLSTVQRESTRMSHLLKDMLTLANADNRSLTVCMQDCELDTLLLDCYESFLPSAKEHQITLLIDLPCESLLVCRCDRDRITQVISILLSNAISYSNPGGTVKIGLLPVNNHWQITVSDNGTGISDSAKEHIFERFYREDSSRSKKDHFGLGLCIAKEIINQHHGSIFVSDTPGGGATFTVLL